MGSFIRLVDQEKADPRLLKILMEESEIDEQP
jgi:hypothetical protein